ncbi:ATP-binding protein [Bradyrhizobium sp. U531]|uniref:ATP-binding protein n=1 Tax=Bradyrhizobium sp. U531 TaxID=3053458 RepID=UPI003F6839DE
MFLSECSRRADPSIQDTGAGVPPQDMERVFDPFFTTRPAGIGPGLAICRTIIERYEGRLVLAESRPQGSTFEVISSSYCRS